MLRPTSFKVFIMNTPILFYVVCVNKTSYLAAVNSVERVPSADKDTPVTFGPIKAYYMAKTGVSSNNAHVSKSTMCRFLVD